MKILKTKINYQDQRGVIRDILTHTPFNAVTFILSKKGAIRGNHFHKKTYQYDYIIKGKMSCFYKKGEEEKIKQKVVEAGDLVFHPPLQRHAYKALEDTEFISITHGPRNGKDYEKDVYRLAGEDKLMTS